ncbi:transglutaminase-like domain-containing protein [Orenia marismortui]|uniref:Transglutaminase superfamily protein n=1 Tax=Orenia marismortui TaxID=46469 RepID=A0A4R8GSI9_9FIRM|nr:transglutaminase-like domain-containing protein [Orenia marismortui]TDX48920.1 transglutaminase superfamily protein [Orenia marismortui]
MYRIIKRLKYLIFIMIFFLGHMVISPGYYVAEAISERYETIRVANVSAQEKKTDAMLLEEKIKEVLNVLEDEQKGKVYESTTDRRLKDLIEEINGLNDDIMEGFSIIEEELKNKSNSSKILERNSAFVNTYQENMQMLLEGINTIINAESTSFRLSKIKELKQKIEKKWIKKEFNPFEHNDFPEKNVDLNPGEPRKYAPITPAYQYTTSQNKTLSSSDGNSQLSANSLQSLNNYRTTETDLQETIEVQISSEIKELARHLDHNPVKIYEYVKNNLDYEPYYGSVKGAQQTLWQKGGNDFDQASLLMALYRESGIPARYVYGTVRIPIEQVKNWVGIEDAETALNTLSSGGIPTTGLTNGVEITHAKIEHTWVEAYLPVANYRGATADDKGKGWVPLDPSFKQYREIEGVNLEEEVPFDAETLMEELESTATIGAGDNSVTNVDQELIKQKFEEHQEALKTYLEENHSEDRMIDIMGGSEIIKEEYSILPLSLPYKVVSVQKEMDALDDSYRQKLSLKVEDMNYWETSECNYTASIPELGSKRISISYVAATEEDAEIIKSYLPEAPADGSEITPDDLPDSLPAHLINVKPQIMVDGQVVATGDAVKMGTIQNFSMKFSYPSYVGLPDDNINNEVTAGASYVVTLNTGKIDSEQLNEKLTALKETEQNLENENFDDLQAEAVTGDILHTIGLSYFAQLDMFNKLLAQKNKVKSTRITSASITAIDLNVSYMFGQPRTASPGGLTIDVDRDLHVSMGSKGGEEQVKSYNVVSGMISSYLEGSIFEQTFGGEAVSTMHILKHANQQGIEVYSINQDNVGSVLPQLEYDSAKKQEFKNLVNNGKEITVPERDVTINGWNGTGYIVLNEDGTGTYMISGGLNGGKINPKVDWYSVFKNAFILAISNLNDLTGYGGYIYTVIDSWNAVWDDEYIILGVLNPDMEDEANMLRNLQVACAFLNLISASTAAAAILGGLGVSIGFAIGLGIIVFLIVEILTIIRSTLHEIYFGVILFMKKFFFVKGGVWYKRYV